MEFLHYLYQFVINAVVISSIPLIAMFFEARNPIETNQPIGNVIVDWKLGGLHFIAKQFLAPVTSAMTILIVNATGGGWITLRSDGLWFFFSFAILILAIDLWTYLIHRAQHKIPVLWAMHSLHHSAESLTLVTGARHFWLEEPLLSTGFPIVAIIFKVPFELVTPITLFYFLIGDGLAHLNMRMSLGILGYFIQNPQYHRIHHSIEPKHRDKNFCKLLPIFDLIFGTAWKPEKDEFPKTGLDTCEKAMGIVDGIMWPIRHIIPNPLQDSAK